MPAFFSFLHLMSGCGSHLLIVGQHNLRGTTDRQTDKFKVRKCLLDKSNRLIKRENLLHIREKV